MPNPKISVITVSFNAQSTIEQSIQSVIKQDYDNVEHIIIDGKSSDSTVLIVNKYRKHIKILISEPDKGIYDAMNKGIALATGDIVGILNADDFFASENVLTAVSNGFKNNNTAIVYGDLNYIKPDGTITRKWVSGEYKKGIFNFGWMPPHPTFYCRRELFSRFGDYSLAFGTAADYELMLRYIHRNNLSTNYVKQVLVEMSVGGVSNNSVKNRIKALLFDMKAMYDNKIFFPPITLLFKPLRKLKQFF